MAIPQLQRITYTACPECKCSVVKSVQIRNLHVCGEWNEYLEFDCGAIYHYVPNYGRVEVDKPCSQTVQQLSLMVTVELALELGPAVDVNEAIKKIKVPGSFSWRIDEYSHNFWGGVKDVRLVKVTKKK